MLRRTPHSRRDHTHVPAIPGMSIPGYQPRHTYGVPPAHHSARGAGGTSNR
ncbi:MAG: hypothetical protein II856_03215 [Bacteroidales bacterium]|nr:hypothetical protein [Bacteroidales bacterium]